MSTTSNRAPRWRDRLSLRQPQDGSREHGAPSSERAKRAREDARRWLELREQEFARRLETRQEAKPDA